MVSELYSWHCHHAAVTPAQKVAMLQISFEKEGTDCLQSAAPIMNAVVADGAAFVDHASKVDGLAEWAVVQLPCHCLASSLFC